MKGHGDAVAHPSEGGYQTDDDDRSRDSATMKGN